MIKQQNLTLSGTTDVLPGVPVTTVVDTAISEVLVIHDRLADRGVNPPVALSAAIEHLRQAVRLEAPFKPSVPLMNIRVLDRSGPVTVTRTVTVPAICPRCGGPRGQELVELVSYVHGIAMRHDRWTNPCGHVDTATELLSEAARFDAIVRGA